ncbi:phosphatidylinositol 4-phosphate 5-kinase-like protein 1 [Tiliqua scincoides]|uniref:phosphatidylinositol 4-phosphate 5-kinase-like protein 1 n=1 Tax=Tiliqua scincoides TaxID=71010 RepID=UPI0034637D04
MQSIFYPHERITERYDIKGCEVGRWTNPAPVSSEIIMVLKDLNFDGRNIVLGQQRDWLIQQMQLDTQFLKELHVIDYSLLVGLQPLHEDDRSPGLPIVSLGSRSPEAAQDVDPQGSIDTLPLSQNRRILSSAKNPLHIIDGPDYRYFMGLVDFFTVYGFRKKLENLWKRIRYRGQRFSTVNPSCYAQRICQWVADHTK